MLSWQPCTCLRPHFSGFVSQRIKDELHKTKSERDELQSEYDELTSKSASESEVSGIVLEADSVYSYYLHAHTSAVLCVYVIPSVHAHTVLLV